MGWKMDWQKFYRYLQQEHGVTRAYLFIGYMSEYEDMYNMLHELGYLIVLKPTVVMNDTSQGAVEQPSKEFKKYDIQGAESVPSQQPAAASTNASTPDDEQAAAKKSVKGNVDAELVLYAMKEMPNYDKAIIVSGDGDFYCLAEYLAKKDRLKHIMTPNRFYSSLLKPYDKYVVRIDELRRELAYKDYRKRTHQKRG